MTRVWTVTGPVSSAELGVTLMHEHLLNDVTSWWNAPSEGSRLGLAHRPLSVEMLGELRHDPFMNLDNCRLDDVRAAGEELMDFRALGGETLVELTVQGIGRDPVGLREISHRTGVRIVMGTGYYLQSAQPPALQQRSIEDIAQEFARDLTEGTGELGVRAGIIGEIGISAGVSAGEVKVLRAAARTQARYRVPLSVHLPGWERHGHRVLDVIAEEGGDLGHVILGHMNPSLEDIEYQHALLERGAYLEYDMIGMDFYYADQQAQSPCDEANARAIVALVRAGWCHRLLLSQDVFLKMQWRRHGGFGYGHVLRHFAPRLLRHGLTREDIDRLLRENPARVFDWEARVAP